MDINKAKGFSLIEVLVSLLLISITILGMNLLQAYTLTGTQQAYLANVATQQMNNMIERLATRTHLAEQLKQWNEENRNALPKGMGYLEKNNSSYQITLTWGKQDFHCTETHLGKSGCILENIYLA